MSKIKEWYQKIVQWLRGTYARRRERILATGGEKRDFYTAQNPIPYGVVIEYGCPYGTDLVAQFDNGEAVRVSCGRTGIINGWTNQYPFPRSNGELVAGASVYLQYMDAGVLLPIPENGKVALHILTYAGVFSALEDWETLLNDLSPLSPLHIAGWSLLKELESSASAD